MSSQETNLLNEMLNNRYEQCRSQISHIPNELTNRLSAPLLIKVTNAWIKSRHKILIVGQESLGWGYPIFHNEKKYDGELTKLHHFRQDQNAVSLLMESYIDFDFASRHDNISSPFWKTYLRFRKEFEDNINASVLWTNLFKSSLDGGSVVKNSNSQERKEISSFSKGLLSDEIDILRPQIVAFFTGTKYYELFLKSEFEGITFHSLETGSYFDLAVHEKLPVHTFRTYHPNYILARNKKKVGHYIDTIIDYLKNKT